MTPDELKPRTKKFALDAIRLSNDLPTSRVGNIIANQLIRSSTSVGANYRSACRARTTADFASRIGITLEEADESVYWMELIGESGMKSGQHLPLLMKEGRELVAIFTTSHQTTRKKLAAQKSNLKSNI